MIKIYCGFISMGNRSSAQVHQMRFIEERYKEKIKLVYPDKDSYRFGHDFARNEVVKEFLRSDCDILWFLDSDICPPENILDLVVEHSHEWKLAGAPYPVFMTPEGETTPQVVFTVYKNMGDGKLAAANIPSHGIDYVDGIATGCLFIKREVFDVMDKPYFKFVRNPENMHVEKGEDIDFCIRAVEKGYKFFIDYSMVCRHYKTVDLLEVNNYAIDFSNKAVLAYDKQMRSNIAQIALATKFRRKADSSTAPHSESVEKTASRSGLILPPNLGV